LDTIYRQKNEDDEDDEDMKKDNTKINEYLTYNWLENF
jgi:hypothetical protein